MPTVCCDRVDLLTRLGFEPQTYLDSNFDVLCFEFGIELDEVMTEDVAAEKRQKEGNSSSSSSAEKRVLYYIAIPANRYDLLCIEGIARALNVFLGRMLPPIYTVAIGPSGGNGHGVPLRITVGKETALIRPYVVSAVLRNVKFDPARYASFIDLQDKLHVNICRRRTLVAIGTHDLDTLQPPFRYDALPPSDITFTPLNQTKAFRADDLMTFYNTDPSVKHIKPYVEIISSSPVFPVILDSKRTVCSLPPIINGDHSKISLTTRNVFIECTATDLTKANVVLNTMVAMFSEYCEKPFLIEPVEVVYEEPVKSGMGGGDALITSYLSPDLAPRVATVSHKEAVSLIGVTSEQITPESAATLCTRMGLQASVITTSIEKEAPDAVMTASSVHGPSDKILRVLVPPTRADVLHECDIIEDIAISFGYNKLERTLPKASTTGEQLPINKLTDHLRRELAMMGYDETLTLALCSREENFGNMLLNEEVGIKNAVILSNPQSEEFQIGRTSMLPGLLKSLNCNRSARIGEGLRLFEVSDVLLRDATSDVGARNERRLAALYSGPTAGFEIIHGLVDRIMELLEVTHRPYKWDTSSASKASTYGRGGLRYYVEPATESSVPTIASYFPGRVAQIVIEKETGESLIVGVFGVLHPHVLKNFELNYPVATVEMNIELF
jgi:phenylalanyl-tRNA synthetase beta chain